MCLSGNEMPRWCHDWTIFNPVQFTEYPRALAFHPRMHGLDILSGGSKHYHVTGRRYVHPEDTAGGSAQFSHNIDRKSTRLNSSHRCISYAVFCLKKKKNQ